MRAEGYRNFFFGSKFPFNLFSYSDLHIGTINVNQKGLCLVTVILAIKKKLFLF